MKQEKTLNPILPSLLTLGLLLLSTTGDILNMLQQPVLAIYVAVILVLIWVSYYLYNKLIIVKYKTKIYSKRDRATPSMKKDIAKFKHIAFIGVSNTSLATYLKETIDNNKTHLPWETITVLFANEDLGNMWEQNFFEKNIQKSKIKIASLLFDESYEKLLPNFKTVYFRQCNTTYNFGGCFCGNTKFDEDHFPLQVIYSVNYLPTDSQTQNSWTIRVERIGKSSNEKHLFEELEKSFICVRNQADDLGEINFSTWEWSSEEWHAFASSYDYFNNGIDAMISGLDLNGKTVLDIGGGTGNVANYLLSKFPYIRLTLLDASANMLNKAKSLLGEKVDYELISFPLKMDNFIHKNRSKYDFIILHLSIQSLVSSKDELRELVDNCFRLLKKEGVVLLAGHNSNEIRYNFANPDVYIRNDEFRLNIENEIRNKEYVARPCPNTENSLLENDIIEAFTKKKNFNLILTESFDFPFTMPDRKRLWLVPAVLNSKVDVKKIGKVKGRSIIEKAYHNTKPPTLNRYIKVFHFQKK